MNQTDLLDRPTTSLLTRFGSRRERVERAVASLRAGGGVIVVDDEDRENEGDIIYPADSITTEQMARLIRDGSGIVCLILTAEHADRLALPPMVADNSARFGTAFTVSIEARRGVTTGVSAADRVTTVRAAIAPDAVPGDLARPGHMFPIRAHSGGLRARRGHTEATIHLMELAERPRAGVLCEITNPDGTMARLPDLIAYAETHGFPLVTIEDLCAESAAEKGVSAR